MKIFKEILYLVQEYICAKEIVAKNISMDNKYIYVRNI
jgi:hypothetical protein